MTPPKRIPISPSVRWQRFRFKAVPLVSFVLAIAASAWLWHDYGGIAQGVGEVDAPHVEVTSPTAGLVMSLPHQARGQWLVYDHIQAGDIIARIEDQQLENNKNSLQQEVLGLIDEVTLQIDALANDAAPAGNSAAAGNAAAPANDPVSTAWQFEKSRLLALDEQLSPDPDPTLDADRDAKPPELPPTATDANRDALARIRQSRRGLELRAADVMRSAHALEVQAPISGTLVAVHCWPGQTVPPGGRIATIAADYGRHIVSYIPEGSSLAARPGMPVSLRPHVAGSRLLASTVEQVGRRVERIPEHLVAAAKTSVWGTPVRIKMPSDAILQPGALVDIVFDNRGPR